MTKIFKIAVIKQLTWKIKKTKLIIILYFERAKTNSQIINTPLIKMFSGLLLKTGDIFRSFV